MDNNNCSTQDQHSTTSRPVTVAPQSRAQLIVWSPWLVTTVVVVVVAAAAALPMFINQRTTQTDDVGVKTISTQLDILIQLIKTQTELMDKMEKSVSSVANSNQDVNKHLSAIVQRLKQVSESIQEQTDTAGEMSSQIEQIYTKLKVLEQRMERQNKENMTEVYKTLLNTWSQHFVNILSPQDQKQQQQWQDAPEDITGKCLIVADAQRRNLFQVNLATSEMVPILPILPTRPIAVVYDENNDVIYWTDVSRRSIGRYSPIGGRLNNYQTIYTEKTYTTGTIDGLALDVVRQKLFYCDAANAVDVTKDFGQICEISTTGLNHRVLVKELGAKPRSIVLDVHNRVMYWTDWGQLPAINTASSVDGSNRQTLVSGDLVWPNALAIDFTEKTMYWADGSLGTIEMSDINGRNRRLLHSSKGKQFYNIAITPQYLYITDWNSRSVHKMSRRLLTMSPQSPQLFETPCGLIYTACNKRFNASSLGLSSTEGNDINGVASLSDQLYIARKLSRFIEVYNMSTLVLLRVLTVTGLQRPVDMTSCQLTNSLYVADSTSQLLFLVQILKNGDIKSSYFSVSGTVSGLSVNWDSNILVTVQSEGVIREYTSTGSIVQNITLQKNLATPWHALEVFDEDDAYVVSHGASGDPVRRVCLVNSDGRMLRSFGGTTTKPPLPSQTYSPVYLSLLLLPDDSILVADYVNNLIFRLSEKLVYKETIVDGDLQGPHRMLYYTAGNQLLVADNTYSFIEQSAVSGRIKTFHLDID